MSASQVWILWVRDQDASGAWRPWRALNLGHERSDVVDRKRNFKASGWQVRVECVSVPVPSASAEPTLLWCPICGCDIPGNTVKCENCEED